MLANNNIFLGIVVKGDGVAARDYDLPTANLKFLKEPDIDTGVYAARVDYEGVNYDAVVCYGVGEDEKFEVHMFGFTGDVMGERLSVAIVDKVSELIPWQSKERMRQKIFHDLELVHARLAKDKNK